MTKQVGEPRRRQKVSGHLSTVNPHDVHFKRLRRVRRQAVENFFCWADICRLAGVSDRTIRRWDRGQSPIRPLVLRRLERALAALLAERARMVRPAASGQSAQERNALGQNVDDGVSGGPDGGSRGGQAPGAQDRTAPQGRHGPHGFSGPYGDLYRLLLCWLAQREGLAPRAVLADDPRAQDKQTHLKARASLCRQRALYLLVTEQNVPLATAGRFAGVSKQAVSKALRAVEMSRDDVETDRLLTDIADLMRGGFDVEV